MNLIREEKTRQIIYSCLAIVLGILLIIYPEIGQVAFYITAGCLFVAIGAFYLVAYFSTIIIHDPRLLLASVGYLLLGSLVFTFPELFLSLAVILASIYFIIQGISHLSYSIDLAQLHTKYWWIDLMYSIVMFLLGIVLVVFSATPDIMAKNVLMIIAGAFFILYGVSDLALILVLHRSYKSLTQIK